MKKRYLFFIAILILTGATNSLTAQEKFEKESRIHADEVPSQAKQFIASIDYSGRIKWYREESLNEDSFEAKFKMNRKWHSIEFSTEGQLLDAEIELDWDQLTPETQQKIQVQLQSDCNNFKLKKAQVQYRGTTEEVLSLISLPCQAAQHPSVRYELVFRCKKNGSTDLYEYLFDSEGEVLLVNRIIFKNTSHLEY